MADEVSGTHNNYPGQALLTALTDESIAAIGAASGGGGGTQDVEVVSPLPAGSNNIGDVDIASALPAGTNNIGDVDVLSVAGVAQLPASLGQKTTVNSMSVTLPSDQGAVPTSTADGFDVALGAKTDAAVTTDANGTVSAKLRGLIVLMLQNLARLPAALTGAGNLKTAIQEAIPAGEAHIGTLGGSLVTSNINLTRPSDTTTYAAKDVLAATSAAVLIFDALGRVNGGSGYLTKARMLTTQSTFVGRLRLHLYHTAPAVITDNAPFTLLFANAANRIGYIDFDVASTEGAGSDAAGSLNTNARLSFICAAADRALYGLLETLDIFTPASAQQFFIELTADQN